MRIDERVREAHLSHYCPGGLGLPVASSRAIGLDRAAADAATEDHRLSAAGTCARCGDPLAPGQDVRRLLSGVTVHATCRPGAALARGSDPPEPPAVLARGSDPPEPPAVLAPARANQG